MLLNALCFFVLIASTIIPTIAVENSCYTDDDCEAYDYTNDYSPTQRTYCQINCPSDSYPPHTALLTSPLPLVLPGNAFIEVPPNRHPSFSGNVTFFAKVNQMAGTRGYLIFYGTTTTRPNFSLLLDSTRGVQSSTILTLQYISRDTNILRTIAVEIPSVASGDHCLTIIFQRTLSIFVDDELADAARIVLPDLDLTTGLSDDDTARLVVGGHPSGSDYFQGTIEQIVSFTEYISDSTRDSVCSFSTSNPIEGQCQTYLDRGDTCVRPTTQQSTLCVSKLGRCDPSLRCFVDIFNQYTCQYLPPICTTDDDCFGSGFCGNAIPSYGSNYFESDIVEIPGEESTYISQAERFDGVRIIRRPATDHPNLDTGLTITTYIQQDPSNSGYVIAKGFDDQMRDWGLLLAYNRIAIVYRTNTGSYETVTFSGITVADGYNYSVSAVIDGTNNQAFISVNGEVTAITLNRQPEFRPGFNFLYIGGRPETTETADNRFKGTIYHLSVYDSALSIDDIQKLDAEFQPNFVNPIELTTTRYCRDYVGFNGYCYLGDDRDFRCKPPARCVPVVINGNTAVQLPKQGKSFSASDIIGRCVTPCACDDDPTSNQVCGSDGRTYASACYADCANIEVVENGACTMTYAELYNRQ